MCCKAAACVVQAAGTLVIGEKIITLPWYTHRVESVEVIRADAEGVGRHVGLLGPSPGL